MLRLTGKWLVRFSSPQSGPAPMRVVGTPAMDHLYPRRFVCFLAAHNPVTANLLPLGICPDGGTQHFSAVLIPPRHVVALSHYRSCNQHHSFVEGSFPSAFQFSQYVIQLASMVESSPSTLVATSYRAGDSPTFSALKCAFPHSILAPSVIRRSPRN